jgi:catechol 2,3-dioxygenase-like lactoylglutathione lyase family enzyme
VIFEEIKMTATVDHIIVPAHDHVASAKLFAEIMGFSYEGTLQHFALVRVNETFVLHFMTVDNFQGYHIAFHVSDDDFEGILARIQAHGISYGNDPRELTNMRTDHPFGGKGFLFLDGNGHLFEVMTKVRA